MVSGNAENKSAFENGIFLKVDSIEPVLKGGGICSRKTYLDGVKVWIDNDGHFFPCDQYTVCDPDVVREDAYRQAFALMREVYNMSGDERREAFSKMMLGEILRDASYDDLAKKLDAWKKEKDEIRVRDEVVGITNGCKMVITVPPKMSSNSVKYMSGISKDGRVYEDVVASAYKKTGVHVDDLDAYLEV